MIKNKDNILKIHMFMFKHDKVLLHIVKVFC